MRTCVTGLGILWKPFASPVNALVSSIRLYCVTIKYLFKIQLENLIVFRPSFKRTGKSYFIKGKIPFYVVKGSNTNTTLCYLIGRIRKPEIEMDVIFPRNVLLASISFLLLFFIDDKSTISFSLNQFDISPVTF